MIPQQLLNRFLRAANNAVRAAEASDRNPFDSFVAHMSGAMQVMLIDAVTDNRDEARLLEGELDAIWAQSLDRLRPPSETVPHDFPGRYEEF